MGEGMYIIRSWPRTPILFWVSLPLVTRRSSVHVGRSSVLRMICPCSQPSNADSCVLLQRTALNRRDVAQLIADKKKSGAGAICFQAASCCSFLLPVSCPLLRWAPQQPSPLPVRQSRPVRHVCAASGQLHYEA